MSVEGAWPYSVRRSVGSSQMAKDLSLKLINAGKEFICLPNEAKTIFHFRWDGSGKEIK